MGDDWTRLRWVSEAVFENPFGERRHALDLRIADASASTSRDTLLQRVVDRVRDDLAGRATDGALKLAGFDEPYRSLVERAILFVAFHEVADELDAHVHAQIEAGPGAEPRPVGAAARLYDRLRAHGLSADATARHVAIIFQMRRAFIFIDRALPGDAPTMRTLRQRLWANVFTRDLGRYAAGLAGRMEDFSTILLGETGTGKGTAAAAIGRSGFIPFDPRSGRFAESFTDAFVALNLAQFPASLLESELFGHRKGAFTGAVDGYDGAFGRCSARGAIFLDEVGDVDEPVQIKLLRVLQERTYTPVGSHEVRRFSGRVIAATNRDLDALRREGRFRDDFYYRLCADVLVMPPLRTRIAEAPDELALLVRQVVTRIVGQPADEVVAQVLEAIARDLPPDYGWPGNVRELEQCVRRVLLGAPYEGDATAVAAGPAATLRAAIDAGQVPARELVASYCRLLYARHGTYEEVARRTELDRRTVKRHIEGAA